MKVLFCNSRSGWMSQWGGDSTQLIETKRTLEDLGVFVEVGDPLDEDLNGLDIVHVFNIQTADMGVVFVEQAKRYGIPVVVSPIYWDFSEVAKYVSKAFPSSRHLPLRALGKIDWRLLYIARQAGLYNRRRSTKKKAERMLEMADMLLPNSYAELEIIVQAFRKPWFRAKSMIVPNGVRVPKQITTTKADISDLLEGLPTPYVLEVASIGPLKGQLSVIKALKDHPEIPLVFVGRGGDSAYGKECQRLAAKRGNVYFLGEIKHESLGSIYSHAKVHVLPSFRESPGLATLEAAIHGVNCVVSIYGPVTEYFGQDVWYCDPLDEGSIRTAVLEAWRSPLTEILKQRISKSFTWKHAGEATLTAYKQMLTRMVRGSGSKL